MAQGASTQRQHYYVPQPMYWPVLGSMSLFLMMLGGVFVMNASSSGWVGVAAGFMLLLYMMFRWFGDVIRESEGGKYGAWEDLSFRWGMIGIRRKSDHERAGLNPVHVIVMAVIFVVVFILTLRFIVGLVVN